MKNSLLIFLPFFIFSCDVSDYDVVYDCNDIIRSIDEIKIQGDRIYFVKNILNTTTLADSIVLGYKDLNTGKVNTYVIEGEYTIFDLNIKNKGLYILASVSGSHEKVVLKTDLEFSEVKTVLSTHEEIRGKVIIDSSNMTQINFSTLYGFKGSGCKEIGEKNYCIKLDSGEVIIEKENHHGEYIELFRLRDKIEMPIRNFYIKGDTWCVLAGGPFDIFLYTGSIKENTYKTYNISSLGDLNDFVYDSKTKQIHFWYLDFYQLKRLDISL